MNRRNVLTALGGLAISGGALFGSGAFTSTEAKRELEVNVVNETDIADQYVDVVLEDVGSHTELGVDKTSDSDGTDDPANLFPDSNNSYGNSGYSPDDTDVSLIENDVKVIFGTSGNELPPNTQVDYDGLFTVVNDGDTTTDDFSVTMSTERGDLLTDQSDNNDITSGTVSSGTTTSLDARLNTGNNSKETDTLTITIS
ncbi:MAG: hypothetical protein ABEH86_08855 [Haloarcula sp.]